MQRRKEISRRDAEFYILRVPCDHCVSYTKQRRKEISCKGAKKFYAETQSFIFSVFPVITV